MEFPPIYDWFLEPVLAEDDRISDEDRENVSTTAKKQNTYFTVWGTREAAAESNAAGVPAPPLDASLLWQTSAVVDVQTDGREYTVIETESGSRYRLCGRMRAAHMVAAGWPVATVRAFQSVNDGKGTAFPKNWREILIEGYRSWREARNQVDLESRRAARPHATRTRSHQRGPLLVVDEELTGETPATKQNPSDWPVTSNTAEQMRKIPQSISREARRLLEQLVRVRFHHPDLILGASGTRSRTGSLQTASAIVGSEVATLPLRSPTRRKRGRPRKQPVDSSNSAEASNSKSCEKGTRSEIENMVASSHRVAHAASANKRKTSSRETNGASASQCGQRATEDPFSGDAAAASVMMPLHDRMTRATREHFQSSLDPASGKIKMIPASSSPSASRTSGASQNKRRPRRGAEQAPSASETTTGTEQRGRQKIQRKSAEPLSPGTSGEESINTTCTESVSTVGELKSESKDAATASTALHTHKRHSKRVRFEMHPMPTKPTRKRASKSDAANAVPAAPALEKALATLRQTSSGRGEMSTKRQRAALRLVSDAATMLYAGDSIFVQDENRPRALEAPQSASDDSPRPSRAGRLPKAAWSKKGKPSTHDAYLEQLQRRRAASKTKNTESRESRGKVTSSPKSHAPAQTALDRWMHRVNDLDAHAACDTDFMASDADDCLDSAEF